MVCNPSNPCGKVFARSELMEIAALAERYDAFVITDEVYEHIVHPPHEHVYFATLPGMEARTIVTICFRRPIPSRVGDLGTCRRRRGD